MDNPIQFVWTDDRYIYFVTFFEIEYCDSSTFVSTTLKKIVNYLQKAAVLLPLVASNGYLSAKVDEMDFDKTALPWDEIQL